MLMFALFSASPPRTRRPMANVLKVRRREKGILFNPATWHDMIADCLLWL
jgi:hypothetical protein